MYTIPLVRENAELDKLLNKALDLPINSWLTRENVVVRAYYQEELKRNEIAFIRAATDVERLALSIDVVLTVSLLESASYSQVDMLVLISNCLNTIELAYSGRDDAPAIFIKQSEYRIIPGVVKYFGTNNKVMAPIYDALSRSNPGNYAEYTEDAPEPGLYASLHKTSTPPVHPDEGGMYTKLSFF